MVGRWWYRIKRRPFVVAAVIAGLVVLVLALYVMPAVLVGPDDKLTVADRLKAENDIRTTLLQALAGATLLVGLYFTGRTFQLNREGQVTERFTRAIDQLGSDKLDVRLGGIYALERLAHASRLDHLAIMEVLTTFVREHARWARTPGEVPGPDQVVEGKAAENLEGGRSADEARPTTDVQTILNVVGRRRREWDAVALNLRNTDLRGADLEAAHLEGADLRGAHLDHASLYVGHLEQANFYGAHLSRANLNGACLAGAQLGSANLENAIIDVADLEGAHLEGAKLAGATFDNSNLRGASFGLAPLAGASLRGADLRDSWLSLHHLNDAWIDNRTRLPPLKRPDDARILIAKNPSKGWLVAAQAPGMPRPTTSTRDEFKYYKDSEFEDMTEKFIFDDQIAEPTEPDREISAS